MALSSPVKLAWVGIVVGLAVGCGGSSIEADAGPEYHWAPKCLELGPPGDSYYAAACSDGELVAAFCEIDGGLVICTRHPSDDGPQVAQPRCRTTATIVCNEGSPDGPRLDYPVCLDDSEPSCEF